MKTKSLLLFVFLFGMNVISYAQAVYQKGYYITNEGEKIEGLILNEVWDKTPDTFSFKLNENSKPQKLTNLDARECSVADEFKFIKATIDVSISSYDLDALEYERNLKLEKQTLFLELIVEGDYKLYRLKKDNTPFFYYKSPDSEIELLVYKPFKNEANFDKVFYNKHFRQQLKQLDSCKVLSSNKLLKIEYYRSQLIDAFIKLNQCSNDSKPTLYVSRQNPRKASIHIGFSTFRNQTNFRWSKSKIIDMGISYAFSPSIQVEIPILSKKHSVAILVEPSFYSNKTEYQSNSYDLPYSVNYKAIRLPIGARKHFFLPSKSTIYASAYAVFDYKLNVNLSSRQFAYEPNLSGLERPIYGLSVGFKHHSGISSEIRFYSKKELFNVKDLTQEEIIQTFPFTINAHTLEFSIKYKLF